MGWGKQWRGFILSMVFFLGMGIFIGAFINQARCGSYQPEILITGEKFVTAWDGRTVLLLDYTVGGIATNATFTENQMVKYIALIGHLERSGRLIR